MTVRVALVGANGHGLHHRRQLPNVPEAELVGLCDVREIADPPPGVSLFSDAGQMLKAVEPEVVIISTPPATHLPLALQCLESGADVLLEKPPVLDLAEHDALEAAVARTGRAVQVGFQALAGLKRVSGEDITVVSAWQRDDVYWNRSPWAGKPPLDGALRNPFAHYTMQALAMAGSDPVRLEVAWLRVRDIQVDDTATLRLTLANGHRVLIAVTLAGEELVDGEMRAGAQEFSFRDFFTDSLLRNLIRHRTHNEQLLAPLGMTRGFTAVAEALGRMPLPGRLDDAAVDIAGPVRTLRGINDVLRRCAADFALLSEVETPWTATISGGAATIG